MGFSKNLLHWIISYIDERRQFVQINVQFGVPKGSILGPVLFYLYANDLNDLSDCTTFQYSHWADKICLAQPMISTKITSRPNEKGFFNEERLSRGI